MMLRIGSSVRRRISIFIVNDDGGDQAVSQSPDYIAEESHRDGRGQSEYDDD